MRAITVKQPYAWSIAAGVKTVENRSRNVSYRGPIAIHAGLGWSKRGAADKRVVHAAAAAGGSGLGALLVLAGHSKVCPAGALIAVAELADCHPAAGCCKPWGDDVYERPGKPAVACHHLVLEDVRALAEPVPCKGALGLWTVPDGLDLAVPA
jgi:hypothetical protein